MRQLRNFNKSASRESDRSTEKMVQEAMQKYGDLDENGLMAQLMQKVSESKANGSFNPAEMLEFASRISPMLDEKQREKLATLLQQMQL